MTTLISLVGEQSTPILLPMLYRKPDHLVLVTTDQTRPIAERLAGMFSNAEVPDDIHAFDIPKIHAALVKIFDQASIHDEKVVFNLTGGTKPMALAAHQLARERGAEWLYLQSQGAKSLLYHYHPEVSENHYSIEEIPALLKLDMVLRAHLGEYGEKTPIDPAEIMVLNAIAGKVDEYKTSVTHGGALEIDLVLRCGNQVGIAEVKTGKKAQRKEGIDQLTTAAEQRYLGTYTRKYLILDREMGSNNRELAEAHRIKIIVLPGLQAGVLSERDQQVLLEAILPPLGRQIS